MTHSKISCIEIVPQITLRTKLFNTLFCHLSERTFNLIKTAEIVTHSTVT